MQDKTNQQYDTAIKSCEEIFIKKTKDYGTSWRVYRTISVVDQIYIKAKRIRNIQEKKLQEYFNRIYFPVHVISQMTLREASIYWTNVF